MGLVARGGLPLVPPSHLSPRSPVPGSSPATSGSRGPRGSKTLTPYPNPIPNPSRGQRGAKTLTPYPNPIPNPSRGQRGSKPPVTRLGAQGTHPWSNARLRRRACRRPGVPTRATDAGGLLASHVCMYACMYACMHACVHACCRWAAGLACMRARACMHVHASQACVRLHTCMRCKHASACMHARACRWAAGGGFCLLRRQVRD